MFGKPQVNNDYTVINCVIAFNLCPGRLGSTANQYLTNRRLHNAEMQQEPAGVRTPVAAASISPEVVAQRFGFGPLSMTA